MPAVQCIRIGIVSACVLMGLGIASDPAFARHHGHHGRVMFARSYARSHPSHVRPGSYSPMFAAYAVDGNSGRVLYGQDENALRHPASITKVMTLYLLFEKLDSHQLTLDDRLPISVHAAAQSPTKLGLRPGSTIRIEDAIKAIVTKSANDMAVAVAERIGGDEATFSQMMTRKAHALGMSRSNFVNASGLPDDMQLTTAHDLVVLGRAIHDHFPHYFHYFSTPSFRYAGQFMPNHNHLMEQVQGMDGIKTGYTRSSGFNLLSSVNRNGHWLVSVVLGGKSRLGRDRIMADLIASQIDKCATVRTAPPIAENPALERFAEVIPVVRHVGDAAPPVEALDDEAAETGAGLRRSPLAAADDDEGSPAVTEAKDGATAEVAAVVPVPPESSEPRPMPARVTGEKFGNRALPIRAVAAAETVQPRPRPAFVTGWQHGEQDMSTTASINRRAKPDEGTTLHYEGAATATPSAVKRAAARSATVVAKLEPPAPRPAATAASVHDFWIIQVGAPPAADKAAALISHAREASRGALGRAKSFTERVQKGRETLFRARFAGLDAATAQVACRNLQRAGMACFAFRN